MSTNNYGEIFCQAAEILAQNLIQKVSYDQTILCTIVDDSEKSLGKYRVSTGEAIFDAYTSDTSFKKNNQVYVSIPNGDWNEQKLIVAKKMSNINQPITYKDPFDSFIDISNNLINTPINTQGLIANDPTTKQILLWSYNGNEIFGGYTRLALSADFKAWLNQLGAVVGEYGLNLIIETEPEDIEDIKTDEEGIPYSNIKICNLNSYDMIGNPYNFESFYNQKKLFDISNLKNIKNIELWFYQKEGTFFNQEGVLIPHENKPPNIFIKDPIVAFGYDANSFEDDALILYSLDSQKYDVKKDPLIDNHKKLQIRWVHKFNNGKIKVVQPEDDINYELHWYRQQLGARSHTVWSGVDWIPLSSQIAENKSVKYKILDPSWEEYNENAIQGITKDPIRKLSYNQSWLLPDTTLAEEKIKVILTYGTEVLYSNIIIFSNVSEVVSKATMDALQALSVNCEDGSFGNYLIYDLGGKIIDTADSRQVREFKAYFNSASDKIDDDELAQLTEANTIEWIVPTKNTMINVEDFISGNIESNYIDENGYQHIFRYGANLYDPVSNSVASGDADIVNQNSQRYKIDSHYDNSKTNNTIKCIVTKNGVQYTAVKELTFGPAGTSGTNYTFVIDFVSNESALTLKSDFADGETISAIIARARLYDYAGKEIPNLETKDIEWSILNEENKIISRNNFIQLFPVEEENEEKEKYTVKNKIELQLLDSIENIPNDNYTILEAILKKSDGNNNGWGDYDLHAYLPIPIRVSRKYPFISGATTIFYNSLGELDNFYQDPYILYYKENNESALTTIDNSKWEIFSDEENDPYIPKMSSGQDGYRLVPLNFYVENSMDNICVVGYNGEQMVWSQPIYTTQNRYPSSILNQWNGELTIDKENNAILAAKVAAGKKNDDNTFSGVIMGDWSGNDTSSAEGAITENTGIYGFHHGEASFGFRDDGTAFIGKSGAGRLEFNGEKSVIQSNRMAEGLGGMLLDFDDGLIHLINPDNATRSGEIKINAAAKRTPFTIGENFGVDWDGKLTATDGTFSGTIYADSGTLGDLDVEGTLDCSEGTIIGAEIIGGTISGARIYFGEGSFYVYEGTLSSGEKRTFKFSEDQGKTTSVKINGETVSLTFVEKQDATEAGFLGYSTGSYNFDGQLISSGVLALDSTGLEGSDGDPKASLPIVVRSADRILLYSSDSWVMLQNKNVKIQAGIPDGYVTIEAKHIQFTGDAANPENQHNIYARFA